MDWQSKLKQMSALQQNQLNPPAQPPAIPPLQIHQPAAMANSSEYRGAALGAQLDRSLQSSNGSNNSASSRDNNYSVDEVQAQNPQAAAQAQPLKILELEDELEQQLDKLAVIATRVMIENDHLNAKVNRERSYQASEGRVEAASSAPSAASAAVSSSNSPAASASRSPVLASAKPKGKRKRREVVKSPAARYHTMNTRYKGKKHPVTNF